MKKLSVLLILIVTFNCSQKKQLQGKTEWQKEINAKFKDASSSPLSQQDLKEFDGLDFFEYDSTYVVHSVLERTPNTEFFPMSTTTERVSMERIYGVIRFSLKGKAFELNVYQGEENLQTKGLEDHLFLPFLDLTNGNTSYGGGRYLNLKIPIGDTLLIDFNEAFNPYCVYNEKFSCPIVPRSNFVNMNIEAGMKDYKN